MGHGGATVRARRLVAGAAAAASLVGVGVVALPAGAGAAPAATVTATSGGDGGSTTSTVAGRGERGDRGDRGDRNGRVAKLRRSIMSTSAEAIGIPVEELRAELRAGRSIAEVAGAKGVEVAEVVDALVATASGKIDAAVESGRLTEQRAQQVEERLRSRFEKVVQRTRRG